MIISIFGKAGTGKTTLLKSIMKSLSDKRKVPVYYWSPYSDDNPSADFKIATNSIVGISEFHLFYSIYKDKINISHLLTGYRHLKMDFVIDSQRPALVPRIVTSLSAHIYCFNITEKRDIEYLAFLSEQAYKLPDLEKFKYIDILAK